MNRNSVLIAAGVLIVVMLLILLGVRTLGGSSTRTITPDEPVSVYSGNVSSGPRITIGDDADVIGFDEENDSSSFSDFRAQPMRAFEARLAEFSGGSGSGSNRSGTAFNSGQTSSTQNQNGTVSSNGTIIFAPSNQANGKGGGVSGTSTLADGKGSGTSGTSTIADGKGRADSGISSSRRTTARTSTSGTSTTRTSTTRSTSTSGTSGSSNVFGTSNGSSMFGFSDANDDNSWSIFYRSNSNILQGLDNPGGSTNFFGSNACPSVDSQVALCGSDGWTTASMVSGGCPTVVCIIGLNNN